MGTEAIEIPGDGALLPGCADSVNDFTPSETQLLLPPEFIPVVQLIGECGMVARAAEIPGEGARRSV